MDLFVPSPWCANTRRRERPTRVPNWNRVHWNGDIQVIYEPDTLPEEVTGHRQNYYMAMYNEGEWHPMAQLECDFDVARHLRGFMCIQQEAYARPDPLCGLFRKEGMDCRPLFQRGYTAFGLPFEQYKQAMDGSTTSEWGKGFDAASLDAMLADGYARTKSVAYHYEPIERVQWLL